MHLDLLVSQGRMMEDSFNITHDLVDRHIGMFPCIDCSYSVSF